MAKNSEQRQQTITTWTISPLLAWTTRPCWSNKDGCESGVDRAAVMLLLVLWFLQLHISWYYLLRSPVISFVAEVHWLADHHLSPSSWFNSIHCPAKMARQKECPINNWGANTKSYQVHKKTRRGSVRPELPGQLANLGPVNEQKNDTSWLLPIAMVTIIETKS